MNATARENTTEAIYVTRVFRADAGYVGEIRKPSTTDAWGVPVWTSKPARSHLVAWRALTTELRRIVGVL